MECEALEEMSRASLDDSLTSIQWLCQLESNKLMQNNLSTTGKIRESPAVVETHFHGNTNKNPYPKPHYSYATLIVLAINSSKEKRMTLQEIYSWIEEHYPFYRFAKKGWKNSIRHNLSLHKFFVKEKRANVLHGKGSYWRISPEGKENLMRDLLKQSNHNLQPPCTLLPHDPDRKLRPIMPKPNCDQDSAKVHYVPFLTCNLPIKFVPTTTAVHSGTDEVTIAPSAATVVRALDSPVDTARPFRITADSTKLSGMAAGTNEMFGSTKATLFSDAVTRTNETTGVATENAERSGTALGTVEASGTAQGTDGTGLTTVVTTPTPTQSETTPVRTPLSSRTSNSSRGLPYSSGPRGSSASKKNRARRKTRTRTSKKRDEIHLAKTRHQNSSPSNSRNLPNILRRKRKTQPRSPESNGGGEEQVPQGVVAQPTLAAINCTNQPMSSPKRGFDDFINSLASSPVAQCNSPFDFLNCFSSPGFSPLRSPVRFSTGLTPLRHEVDSGIMITPVHGGLGDIGFNWTPFKTGFTPLVTSPPRNTTRNGGGSQGCRKSLGLEKINEVDSVLE